MYSNRVKRLLMGQRCPVAIAAAAAFVATVLLLEIETAALVFGAAALMISWEWGRLNEASLPLAALHPFLLAMVLLYATVQAVPVDWFLYIAVAWWTIMFLIISTYQPSWRDTLWLAWLFRIGSVVVISTTWLVITLLHRVNVYDLFYLAGLVAIVDIAAYVSGKLWGQRKLIPDISPAKTYAGLWGAAGAALILSSTVAAWAYSTWLEGINFVLMSGIIALAAIIGDFSESLLKRRAGLKNSGTLLPGHGGLLDRSDSLLAASPLFVLMQY